MNQSNSNQNVREWLSVAAAVVAGPVSSAIGHSMHLVYALAGMFYFLFCATVIPLLAYAAGRLKFLVWQVAIFSLIVTTIYENRSVGVNMGGRELFTMVYFFWFSGTLVSSPLLIYYRLKPLPPRRRFIEGAIFAVTALVLFGGLTVLDHS